MTGDGDRRHPLSPFSQRLVPYSQSAAAQTSFELGRLTTIYRVLNLPSFKEFKGSKDPKDFEWFNSKREFDYCLHSFMPKESLHLSSDYVHPKWFKSFLKLPVLKHYLACFPTSSVDRKAVLCFPRKGLKDGLVLYCSESVPSKGFFHVGYVGEKLFVVQPFIDLIGAD
jgi:hypothetical protein